MKHGRVLVIEDDLFFGDLLKDGLGAGFEVEVVRSVSEAERVLSGAVFDVLLVDERLPDGRGRALIERLRKRDQDTPIVVVTADPQVDDAASAMSLGISDYLVKPVTLEGVRFALLRALRAEELQRLAEISAREHAPRSDERQHRPRWMETAVARAAGHRSPVLVLGETGVGKGIVARAIHDASGTERPFVRVNCGSLPETLIESELFGSEAGAFTGARARRGLFELADGGTLFLDEIGDMPLHLQGRLLTVLEDGLVRRVGSERERSVQVRVIAATNVDIELAVREKRFRGDLFYRLDVMRIEVPPLRNRMHELPELVQAALVGLGAPPDFELAVGELERLARYGWPGNVRELRSVLERALWEPEGRLLFPSHFVRRDESSTELVVVRPERTLAEVERDHIEQTLARHSGRLGDAARSLAIDVSTLRRKLRSWT